MDVLRKDIQLRVDENQPLAAELKASYQGQSQRKRTGETFDQWLENTIDQAASAWVLACVFVRFCEDNALLNDTWIAGIGEADRDAQSNYQEYFGNNPSDSDREYFLHVFEKMLQIPALTAIFDKKRNPIWSLGPTADGAMKLREFWREIESNSGELKRQYTSDSWDTRFLGDLYQGLSEFARKRFALLQTPDFVEEFILDRTLEPAINEFGLDGFRIIDPTCGSGHFLLGSFERLFNHWRQREPQIPDVALAQKVLDSIFGVDVNPFAIAIAKFRLTVTAMKASGVSRLMNAPAYRINLATGDSLVWGSKWASGQNNTNNDETQALTLTNTSDIFDAEDPQELKRILGHEYHAVVGNPPYITVKDKVLNQLYRSSWATCHRKYSLVAPFTEMYWGIAKKGAHSQKAGFVGIIASNSFMKREFGKRLIEDFFPTVELSQFIDASGAYLPGHGTPTVIMFGRNRTNTSNTIRGILGIRGEPSTPPIPAQGLVWKSIVEFADTDKNENDFVSATTFETETLAKHPWPIGGGGAAELKTFLDETSMEKLRAKVDSIGFMAITGEDDAFVAPKHVFERYDIDYQSFVVGECVRDWRFIPGDAIACLYRTENDNITTTFSNQLTKYLWPFRTILSNRLYFGATALEAGLDWREYRFVANDRMSAQKLITFAFVATHNHFVLDRGGKIFNRSAPVIKLPNEAEDQSYLQLLGLLNSSTAGFWFQQVFHNKGGPGGGSSKDEKWHDFYEHDGTKMKQLPVPNGLEKLVSITNQLDRLSSERMKLLPIVQNWADSPSKELLEKNRIKARDLLHKMISAQEALDWKTYEIFGLINESDGCTFEDECDTATHPGQRAFEICAAQDVASASIETKWFEKLDVTPTLNVDSIQNQKQRNCIENRIKTIRSSKNLRLIESMNCKRRWEQESWKKQEREALTEWILNKIESTFFAHERPSLTSLSELSIKVSNEPTITEVIALREEREDADITAVVKQIIFDCSVPFLSRLYLKDSGVSTYQKWKRMWDLQRKQDSGEHCDEIEIPPKYKKSDFVEGYWQLRGKLNAPKERYIIYPLLASDQDPTPVIGWAGWDHLHQAIALGSYMQRMRDEEGWDAQRLRPALEGLGELMPWVEQWHPDEAPEIRTYFQEQARDLGVPLSEIGSWEPTATLNRRKKKKKKKTS